MKEFNFLFGLEAEATCDLYGFCVGANCPYYFTHCNPTTDESEDESEE